MWLKPNKICVSAQVISFAQPGVGESHGCPFRHMDPDLLQQRLSSSGRLPSDAVEGIMERTRSKQYQLACREYFKAMNPQLKPEEAQSVNINHPNQFFELGQKVAKGISLVAAGSGDGTNPQQQQQPSRVKALKVPLNESSMMNRSGTMDDDASIDAELSKIDSTLMEYSGLDF